AVSCGSLTACARSAEGVVSCWGGLTRDYDGSPLPPTVIPGIPAATEIVVTEHQGCARDANGGVWRWELFLGRGQPSTLVPRSQSISGITDAVRLFRGRSGGSLACVLRSKGPPSCIGGPTEKDSKPWPGAGALGFASAPLKELEGATDIGWLSGSICGLMP